MFLQEMFQKMKRSIPLKGVAAVFGGFLLQFTMGAFYSFGNMSTYMVSYMRQYGSPNLTYTDFIVVQSAWGMTQGTVMPFSGFLIRIIGEKAAMTLGATIFSAGCALTYITINKELWMVAATYGFVSAFGQNIALIPTLTTGMKWFPDRKGTVMGIVVGGFGGGAMVFNQIQTKIVNPDNVKPVEQGGERYFVDDGLLDRVPNLLLILAGIYFVLGITGALLVNQPPAKWLIEKENEKKRKVEEKLKDNEAFADLESVADNSSYNIDKNGPKPLIEDVEKDDTKEELKVPGLTWKQALRRKEFYILWVTRLSVVLITQVVAAMYKAFGQTFIFDDQFLAMVGSAASVFNCSGRLVYGLIMDKTSYRIGMSIEAVILSLLVSSFYLTKVIDPPVGLISVDACQNLTSQIHPTLDGTRLNQSIKDLEGRYRLIGSDMVSDGNDQLKLYSPVINATLIDDLCADVLQCENDAREKYSCEDCNHSVVTSETSVLTKAVYAIWVWSIFLTFPGTYSMQPAVTAQTFGHRHAGTIYAFLFSSDIVNNLMVATLTTTLKEKFCYSGLFLIISIWGIVALIATLLYPKSPDPGRLSSSLKKKEEKVGQKEYKRAPGIETEMT